MIFTTSWDDGSVLDLRVAEMLSRYDMKGTFYVPKFFDGRNEKHSAYERRLNEDELRKISEEHEIGAHGLTHARLTTMDSETIRKELKGGKDFLEEVVGREVPMLAFPGGLYTEEVAALSQGAGFAGARTTEKLSLSYGGGHLLHPTIICQPFPFRQRDATHYYWRRLFDPLRAYHPRQYALSWQALARRWFTQAYERDGYFHVYGHSWELEKYGMWEDLTSFLSFVHDHSGVAHRTNGEIVRGAASD